MRKVNPRKRLALAAVVAVVVIIATAVAFLVARDAAPVVIVEAIAAVLRTFIRRRIS